MLWIIADITEHTATICIELSGLNVPYQLPPNSSVKPAAFNTNVGINDVINVNMFPYIRTDLRLFLAQIYA